MDSLAEGFYCPECGFFEEIDLNTDERCNACGHNESEHIPALVVEKSN